MKFQLLTSIATAQLLAAAMLLGRPRGRVVLAVEFPSR
jgi:hypothetical protein